VLQSKRDYDVRCLGLVQLETRLAIIAPSGKIHDLGGLGCGSGSRDRLDNVESVAVEEKRVLAEQVVELGNHGMVVGNGAGFELAQSSLELCGVKFHCTLLFGSLQGNEPRDIARSRVAGASHLQVVNASTVIPRGLPKLFPHAVK
jgi:hypothetical protein